MTLIESDMQQTICKLIIYFQITKIITFAKQNAEYMPQMKYNQASIRLQTPVTDEICRVGISYSNSIMMLGSCFTDNIGARLSSLGFDVAVNPFGTLYNPMSILQSIRRMASHTVFTEKDCVEIGAGDGRICSFCHHTAFARRTVEEFLEKANNALYEAVRRFKQCDRLIITLGTSWCFRHMERDFIVSNCLKRDAKEFSRELMSAEDTKDVLKELIDICTNAETPKKIIFTVSPIRHFKDGAHGNQISKSSLLLGTDLAMNEICDYFPAYEIMMDELRDYRFYAEDMNHPSQQAVNYIGDRFLQWALPAEERPILEENIRKARCNAHMEKEE